MSFSLQGTVLPISSRLVIPLPPTTLPRRVRVLILVVVETVLAAMVSSGWQLQDAVEVLTAGAVVSAALAVWL